MKIFICTDLEGIGGITCFDQTRDKTNLLYQEARHLLTQEVNACVQGCLDGGATDIIVRDGHGGGFNFFVEDLHPAARYITGPGRPRPDNGMDSTIDGLILLGYHAMNGTEDGVLHHTQSSLGENKYWYNGVESGELVQTSLVAGYHDIPPIMCSGDLRCCEEARRFLGDEIVTVVVKEGFSRTSSIMYAPAKSRELVREGARKAMAVIPRCRPYKLPLPITGRLQLKDKEAIDRIVEKGLSRRIDDFTVERVFDDPRDVYRFQ